MGNDEEMSIMGEWSKEKLLTELERSDRSTGGERYRQILLAFVQELHVKELTGVLDHLSSEIAITREEMHDASEAASKHTQSLQWATWALFIVTALYTVAAFAQVIVPRLWP